MNFSLDLGSPPQGYSPGPSPHNNLLNTSCPSRNIGGPPTARGPHCSLQGSWLDLPGPGFKREASIPLKNSASMLPRDPREPPPRTSRDPPGPQWIPPGGSRNAPALPGTPQEPPGPPRNPPKPSNMAYV